MRCGFKIAANSWSSAQISFSTTRFTGDVPKELFPEGAAFEPRSAFGLPRGLTIDDEEEEEEARVEDEVEEEAKEVEEQEGVGGRIGAKDTFRVTD